MLSVRRWGKPIASLEWHEEVLCHVVINRHCRRRHGDRRDAWRQLAPPPFCQKSVSRRTVAPTALSCRQGFRQRRKKSRHRVPRSKREKCRVGGGNRGDFRGYMRYNCDHASFFPMSLVGSSHIVAQTTRVLVVSLAAPTTIYLAFRHLPNWLAWSWTVVAAAAWAVNAWRLAVLIYAAVADRRYDRENR